MLVDCLRKGSAGSSGGQICFEQSLTETNGVTMRLRTLDTALLFGMISIGAMGCAQTTADLPKREMPAGATFSWKDDMLI